MLLPQTLIAVIAAATVVAASPLEKRADGKVHLCQEANWGGTCENLSHGLGKCVKLNSTPFYHDTSGFGPESGIYCNIFSNDSCSGDAEITLTYPGSDSINGLSQHAVSSTIESYVCYADA